MQEIKTLKARGDAIRCVQLLLDAVRTRPITLCGTRLLLLAL
jgi:hypothetical protein